MALKVLFIVHGIVTVAAGVVLIVAPALIPSTVGIVLPPEAFLVSYLFGACEIGVGVISLLASRVTDVTAIRVICVGFIVLHLVTASVEIFAFEEGVSPLIIANAALRVVVAGLFGWFGLRRR
jgi:hypothetical protein